MTLLASRELISPPASTFTPRRCGQASHVEIYEDASQVLPIWQDLISVAHASVYQTPGFLLPWLATRGAEAKIAPLFIVQTGGDGKALALFCLGVKMAGPCRVAVFLGAKDSNFNFGLFRPGYAPDGAAITAIFRTAAQAIGSKAPDLFLLLNQPLEWNGWSNPLAAQARQWSPSFAYRTSLSSSADDFFAAKLSKDARKKLRKKESRLAEMGPVRYAVAGEDESARRRIIETFFAQKIARFEKLGIETNFESMVMRHFVEAACAPSNAARLELHALFCGETIVAVYGGATHQGHFSGFFNSFDADPQIAKSSPGDLLLMKLIAAKCAAGVTSFDLGIGEARYKNMVCDEAVPLFDGFIPVTLKGWIFAVLFFWSQRIKRGLKQNTRAFEIVRRVRATLLRKA